jgi:hypothetical protein
MHLSQVAFLTKTSKTAGKNHQWKPTQYAENRAIKGSNGNYTTKSQAYPSITLQFQQMKMQEKHEQETEACKGNGAEHTISVFSRFQTVNWERTILETLQKSLQLPSRKLLSYITFKWLVFPSLTFTS